MTEVWLNGAILDARTAAISARDRGFLLGDGAFETLKITCGGLRRWPRHRARLLGGLGFLGIDAPDLDEIEDAAAQLAARAGLAEAVARLTVSRGAGAAGLELAREGEATVLLTVAERVEPAAALRATVLTAPRRGGLPAERFKLSGYGGLIEARRAARSAGADRALVTGQGGALACADCANLFWIRDGAVFTPALETGALPGTTRAALLEAAAGEGLAINEVADAPSALGKAQAAFTTNAIEGVRALTRIDGAPLDSAHPLMARLRDLEASVA